MTNAIVESKSTVEIRDWMTDYLATQLRIDRARVDVDRPFDEYGIDSAAAMRMIGDLEDFLGHELSPSLPYQYSTIDALANALSEAANGQEGEPD